MEDAKHLSPSEVDYDGRRFGTYNKCTHVQPQCGRSAFFMLEPQYSKAISGLTIEPILPMGNLHLDSGRVGWASSSPRRLISTRYRHDLI